MHFFLHTYIYIHIYICMCVYYYVLSDGVMSCHRFIMACMATCSISVAQETFGAN